VQTFTRSAAERSRSAQLSPPVPRQPLGERRTPHGCPSARRLARPRASTRIRGKSFARKRRAAADYGFERSGGGPGGACFGRQNRRSSFGKALHVPSIVRSRNVTLQLSPALFPAHASNAAGGGPCGRSADAPEGAAATATEVTTENNRNLMGTAFMTLPFSPRCW